MDCDFENLLICKRKLKKNGVTYRTVMEESVQARRLRNSGRSLRAALRTGYDYHDRKKSMMDVYDESGTVIATESLTVQEEYTMYENVGSNRRAVWERRHR
jgi:hypothetical protein